MTVRAPQLPSRLKGVPLFQPAKAHGRTGHTYWVGNGAGNTSVFLVGSDDNSGISPETPLATLDAAINKCVRGDTIYVMQGHYETVSGAAGIDIDVHGINIIGLPGNQGQSYYNPWIVCGTVAGDYVEVNASDVYIANITFWSGINEQTTMVNVATGTAGVIFDNCYFFDDIGNNYTALTMLTMVGGGEASSINNKIINCEFRAETTTTPTSDRAIALSTGAQYGLEISGCFIYGNFDDAGIWSDQAHVDLQITDNYIANEASGQHAIELTAAASGIIANNVLCTDAVATTLDPGSCFVGENTFATVGDRWPVDLSILGTDDANNLFDSSTVVANRDGSIIERIEFLYDALVDDATTNLIGVDDASNLGTTASVTADVDGSILERLEHLAQVNTGGAAAVTSNPRLGLKVTKTTADTITGAAVSLFSVSGGRVLMTALYGEVTTVIGGGANASKLQFNPTTGTTNDLCATLDIDADEAGTLYSIDGTPATAMLRSESGAVANMDSNGVILDIGDVEFTSAADATGSIQWTMWYIPLDTGASVAAA